MLSISGYSIHLSGLMSVLSAGTDGGGHVAINFFGLTRSLHHTIDSIEEYLLMPIREAGYKVRPFHAAPGARYAR